MPNLLEQAINSDDGDRAAKIIQGGLGIDTDDVANYVFPKTWPPDRAHRAHDRRLAADRGAVLDLLMEATGSHHL